MFEGQTSKQSKKSLSIVQLRVCAAIHRSDWILGVFERMIKVKHVIDGLCVSTLKRLKGNGIDVLEFRLKKIPALLSFHSL